MPLITIVFVTTSQRHFSKLKFHLNMFSTNYLAFLYFVFSPDHLFHQFLGLLLSLAGSTPHFISSYFFLIIYLWRQTFTSLKPGKKNTPFTDSHTINFKDKIVLRWPFQDQAFILSIWGNPLSIWDFADTYNSLWIEFSWNISGRSFETIYLGKSFLHQLHQHLSVSAGCTMYIHRYFNYFLLVANK